LWIQGFEETMSSHAVTAAVQEANSMGLLSVEVEKLDLITDAIAVRPTPTVRRGLGARGPEQ